MVDTDLYDHLRPDAGRTLLPDVRVTTFRFVEIGSDGVTRTAQPGSCTDYTRNLPHQFGVNQKFSGTIELVVPDASGMLALQDTLDNTGGWEWTY